MKREAGAFLARTDDKKARWEAGLDLDLSRGANLIYRLKSLLEMHMIANS